MENINTKKFIILILILLSTLYSLILIIRFILLSNQLPIKYWDEFHWISKTYFYDFAFIKKKFQKEIWQSNFAKDHPFVAPFIYGTLIHLKYNNEIKKEGDFTRFIIKKNFYEAVIYVPEYQKNKINYIPWNYKDTNKEKSYLLLKYGKKFSETIDIILYLRKINSLFLLFSVFAFSLLFFFITRSLLFSFLFFVILSSNKFFTEWNIYVHSDIWLNFFNSIFLLSFFNYYKKNFYFDKNVKKNLSIEPVISILVLIFLTSIVFNTKISGAINLIFLFVIFCVVCIRKKVSIFNFLVLTIIFISFANLLLEILNPSLFMGFLTFSDLIIFRTTQQYLQTLTFNEAFIKNSFHAINIFIEKFFLNKSHNYYNYFFSLPGNIKIFLFIFGIFLSAKEKFARALLFFFSLNFAFYIFLIKLNWDRYFLIFIPFLTFFQTYATMILTKFLLRYFKN
ncbi:MAG: hypothetical protein KatS3mg091_665 [Patescibacteria group bacterium]|nr:MAG: hypothetical protein KatS3mg090_0012 [Patescibacteria group bacterium]GIW63863.1 MAG: hypothetical protein KatS3mg091_665 [Patescibacteria group bacterium]